MQHEITISIVSHAQGELVARALESLARVTNCSDIEIIATKNLPEQISYPSGLHVVELCNLRPRGFAQNHNRAFEISHGKFFCVLNPDVVFQQDVFPPLLRRLATNPRSVVAPVTCDRQGRVQDSFRQDLTFLRLLRRKLFGWQDYDYATLSSSCERIEPDLIAGMFLLMPREIYSELQGFDEKYWLYFEDADFARRCRETNIGLFVYPTVQVVHVGRRAGRKRFSYSLLHYRSMLRYILGA